MSLSRFGLRSLGYLSSEASEGGSPDPNLLTLRREDGQNLSAIRDTGASTRPDTVSVVQKHYAKLLPKDEDIDRASGRVYCNIEDKSEVVAIDSTKHEVIARWPVAPGEEPGGIAFDPAMRARLVRHGGKSRPRQ